MSEPAITEPAPVPAPAAPAKPAETVDQKYARHTRNATVFVAFAVGIMVTLRLIVGIIVAHDVTSLNHNVHRVVNTLYNSGSNCQSVGGTNPTC
jgi:hypothetical protein